ncbi:MAG: DUF1501 domain-containing protein [Bdellovibrionales bacterium]|nr:DUF1501 domain-containing protein [Bdellovibrionales bacterium]
MNRRNFLSSCGRLIIAPYALNGLAGLFGQRVLAAELGNFEDHLLLVIRIWGAMDCTLGLNPWIDPKRPDPRDLFLDENYYFLRAKNANLYFGPSAAPLEPFANNLAVVNGIFMGATDLGHPFAQNYITTSKGSPDTPHFIAELAEDQRRGARASQETVLFKGQVRTFDLETIGKLPLEILSDRNNQLNSQSGKDFDYPTLSFTGDDPLMTAYRAAAKVEADRKGFLHYLELLQKKSNSNAPATANPFDGSSSENEKEFFKDCVLVSALAGGVARFAQVDWEYSDKLDTHTGFKKRHQDGQRHAWTRVASILKMLSSLNNPKTNTALFPNHVTLAVITEFSRPPFLNDNEGKDHNYFDNSALLGGRGIRGGQSIGAHHLFVRDERRRESQLSGGHIDFKTGAVVKSAEFSTGDVNRFHEQGNVSLIRPENILKTLGDVFNVDQRNMRLFSPSTLALPNIINT